MDRTAVVAWIEAYEEAWRSPGTERLAELFTDAATYLPSPWREPLRGLPAIVGFWDAEREGPDEVFTMRSEVLALDADHDVAVARVEVDYGEGRGTRWRDLWVIRFAPDGRCSSFEEWPFAPDQPDGH